MTGLDQIEFWHWWIAAVAFTAIEVFAPSVAFIWMGVSAAIVGFLLLLFPETAWESQFLFFAVLSVASVALWRFYRFRHPPIDAQPNLNRRGHEYIDRTFMLDEGISNGQAKLLIDGVIWKIRGKDLPPGSKVHVTAVDGTVLVVEPE
jgi:hypothetical protein